MTVDDIIKCKNLEDKLNILIEEYYNEYLKNPYEEYSDWKWSPGDSHEIIIIYWFWNYHDDEWDYGEYYVKFEELINFKF